MSGTSSRVAVSRGWLFLGMLSTCAVVAIWGRSCFDSNRSGGKERDGEPEQIRDLQMHPTATTPPIRAPMENPTELVGMASSTLPTVTIRVLDAATKDPLLGARVVVMDSLETDVLCNAKGECSIPIAKGQKALSLRIEKKGYFHVQALYLAERLHTVRLYKATGLSGRVVEGDTGSGIPGARITLLHDACRGCRPDVTTSGSSGEYWIGVVPTGKPSLTFRVEAAGFPTATLAFEVDDEENPAQHDFVLDPGIVVRGRVVDFETGAGIAGANVNRVPTDGEGSFVVRVVPATVLRKLALVVKASGYASLQAWIPVEDVAGPSKVVVFRLPESAVVSGIVVAVDGTPVENARISAEDDVEELSRSAALGDAGSSPLGDAPERFLYMDEESQDVKTTSSGTFRLGGILPWRHGVLIKAHTSSGLGIQSIPDMCGPGGEVSVRIVVPSPTEKTTAIVRGKVLVNGEWWRGAKGSVWCKQNGDTVTGVIIDGTFALKVRPGQGELHLDLGDCGRAIRSEPVCVRMTAGEEIAQDLEVRRPMDSIEGMVRFQEGEPGCHLRVLATPSWEGLDCGDPPVFMRSAETDADGYFSINVPVFGTPYSLTIADRCDRPALAGILPGDTGVIFMVQDAGILRLRLRDQGSGMNVPTDGFIFAWADAGNREFRPLWFARGPIAGGWYETVLPVGTTELSVRSGLWSEEAFFRVRTVKISSEEPSYVEMEVGESQTIVGGDGK